MCVLCVDSRPLAGRAQKLLPAGAAGPVPDPARSAAFRGAAASAPRIRGLRRRCPHCAAFARRKCASRRSGYLLINSNAAERAVRPVVLARKTTGGSRSRGGGRNFEILMTVREMCGPRVVNYWYGIECPSRKASKVICRAADGPVPRGEPGAPLRRKPLQNHKLVRVQAKDYREVSFLLVFTTACYTLASAVSASIRLSALCCA